MEANTRRKLSDLTKKDLTVIVDSARKIGLPINGVRIPSAKAVVRKIQTAGVYELTLAPGITVKVADIAHGPEENLVGVCLVLGQGYSGSRSPSIFNRYNDLISTRL